MTQEDTLYDAVIVGAGPTGVEALLQANELGMKALLLEKDCVGSLIRRTMAEKIFLKIYGRNTSELLGSLDFPDRIIGRELVALWEKQIETLPHLDNVTVNSLSKSGQEFYLASSNGNFRSKKVILTFGTFENPRKLGIDGEKDNPKVRYAFDYQSDYYKNKIVVVGGGNSALETASNLAFDSNDVVLVVRRNSFADTVTEKNKKDIEEAIQSANLKVLYESEVFEIGENEIKINEKGNISSYDYDVLFINIGYERPTEFLKAAGVNLDGDKPTLSENFETSVPGLFIAGSLTGADSIIESANQAYKILHSIVFCQWLKSFKTSL